MKIVIDIEDYDREWIANGYHIPDEINGKIAEAIIDGTPLPEHHGRLMILSEDIVKENQINLDFSCQKWISEVGLIYATNAIIEADKEVDE